MGTNPYLLWIVGAPVEPDDPRFDRARWEALGFDWYEAEIPVLLGEDVFDDFDLVTARGLDSLPEKRPTLGDAYYYGSPMQAAPDEPHELVGYIIHASRDQHLLRGLCLVPGFEALFEAGHVELPQRDDLHTDLEYRDPYRRAQGEKALTEHRFIEMYKPWRTDQWYSVALHVLHFVGWTGITREHLRLFMVFEWA